MQVYRSRLGSERGQCWREYCQAPTETPFWIQLAEGFRAAFRGCAGVRLAHKGNGFVYTVEIGAVRSIQ